MLGCCVGFFILSLSLLDPILLVTNHKERIDVWLYKPSHHSVQSWAGRSAQYQSITCVRNEVSSSLPFLQQQQLYIFRAIVMDQLEKLPDVPLAPLLPPPLPLPLPRLSKCCCMYVYILFNFLHSDIHAGWIDTNGRFMLKPKFLEVVRSLPNTNQDQIFFSYQEVRKKLFYSLLTHTLSRPQNCSQPTF